ncbi:MAG: hypothetical protein JJU00_19780 [Opitutales bacterium]|nr:hypothetical protein [Opitutales bacterium]
MKCTIRFRARRLAAVFLFLAVSPAALADACAGAETEDAPRREIAETTHSVEIDGQTIHYRAKAGKLPLRDAKGEVTAEIFFIAYLKEDQEPENRPLTFSFNGGPGSSSVWMHVGLLGPRRVHLNDDGTAPPPPHQLVDNEYSLLDVSDLVFIDPVSTGFSRAVDPEKEKSFHGLDEDAESVALFIHNFVTEHERWSSPKFLIGESYGTTRAAALARQLQNRHGMYLNGLMLVSAVFDFSTLQFGEDNDLPFVVFLPTFAATAQYHGRLDDDLQMRPLPDLLAEVEAFAVEVYAPALLRGGALPEADQAVLAADLARYTGLDVDIIREHWLRPSAGVFFEHLLKDKGKRIGRFDGRYTGSAPTPWDRGTRADDPSFTHLFGPYTSALNDLLRRELNYKSDRVYEILTNVWPWDYGSEFRHRYVNVGPRLREAMRTNPHLRVHVCSGYYDLATPYFAFDYTLDRLYLDPDLRANIVVNYYEAGHMMYSVRDELARQKEALARFIRATVE